MEKLIKIKKIWKFFTLWKLKGETIKYKSNIRLLKHQIHIQLYANLAYNILYYIIV